MKSKNKNTNIHCLHLMQEKHIFRTWTVNYWSKKKTIVLPYVCPPLHVSWGEILHFKYPTHFGLLERKKNGKADINVENRERARARNENFIAAVRKWEVLVVDCNPPTFSSQSPTPFDTCYAGYAGGHQGSLLGSNGHKKEHSMLPVLSCTCYFQVPATQSTLVATSISHFSHRCCKVSHCHAKQWQRNVQKKCAAHANLLFCE